MTYELDTSLLAISMLTGGKPQENLSKKELHSLSRMITFTFDKNFVRLAQVPKQLNKKQIVCSFSLVFCFGLLWDLRKSIKFFSKVKVIVSIFINLTLIQDYPGSSENSVNYCNPFPFGDNHMLNLTIISLELISYVIQITITFCVVLFFTATPSQ